MFVVVPLPQSAFKGAPLMTADAHNILIDGDRFEPLYNTANGSLQCSVNFVGAIFVIARGGGDPVGAILVIARGGRWVIARGRPTARQHDNTVHVIGHDAELIQFNER